MVLLLLSSLIPLSSCSLIYSEVEAPSEFTVKDTLPDGEGREATVILLAGQSNASGCSRDEYLKKGVTSEKHAEYEAGYDNVYINYYATGTNVSEEFVRCGACQGELGDFFGPELGLAETLHESYPDKTFFIIKFAWGGTNLFDQWLSPSGNGETGELYQAFVNYTNTSLDYLTSKGYNVTIDAMCWMQGESDSFSLRTAIGYKKNLKNFIRDVRDEFESYASDDGIAFVDAYIADTPTLWIHYDRVNKSKQRVADSSPINVVIDTVSEGLTCVAEPEEEPDLAHYDALSQLKLGHLFGKEVVAFID